MPAHKYYSVDGSAVPSVSTLKSQTGWGTRGLMNWANRRGLAGFDINERQSEAADVGTVAHAAIEAEVKGRPFDIAVATAHMLHEQREQVDRCIVAWARWKEQTRLEVLESEVSLVSEAYRFGGTLDCLANAGGSVSLIDLKTGNDTYADHLVQVAAYGLLVEEARGIRVEDYHLLRLGKESGAFHHTSIPADGFVAADKQALAEAIAAMDRLAEVAPATAAVVACRTLQRVHGPLRALT